MKWLLCVSVLIVVGCGQNEQNDNPQDEKKSSIEGTADVHDESVDTSQIENEANDDSDSDALFTDVFDSSSYLKSKDKLRFIVGEEYLNLAEDDFKHASNELIQYRSALVREQKLSAWLLASDIENALSSAIIKKVERDELSVIAAQSILNQYSERFYSVTGIAKVFDEELGMKRSQRFGAVEAGILKDQLGMKKPKDASDSQRYAALWHHISGITGGLENQVSLDWAGNAYGIVILSELFNAHKNAAMTSIYLDYLNDGGMLFEKDQQGLDNFKEAISGRLKSTKLIEFSGFGYTKITPPEMTTYLSGI